MSPYSTTSLFLQKRSFQPSQSAKDSQPSRFSAPTMIYYLELDSTPTTIANMRASCSKSEDCALRGPCTRNLRKSCRVWGSISKSKEMKITIHQVLSRTHKTMRQRLPQTMRWLKKAQNVPQNDRGGIQKAPNGIWQRKLDPQTVETLSLQLQNSTRIPMESPISYRNYHRRSSAHHRKRQPIIRTRNMLLAMPDPG